MNVRNPVGTAVAACAAGLLLLASACSSGGDDPGDEETESGGSGDTAEIAAESNEIRSWEGVCGVFDPDSILSEFGGEYLEGGPEEIGLDAGMFLGALSCNALFVPESDPDQTQSIMYLNLSPSDNAELAKQQYDEIWERDFENHSTQGNDAPMLASEEDMEGEWDEAAMFVTTGGDGDRVWAYYLKGSYLVQIQLIWGPDEEVRNAEVDGEDLAEAAELDFTPLDIAGWVKNTYLPQIYEAIEAKIAEGTGE